MMEDPLIEKNNGLNDMSAYDGGSSDLDETEDEGSEAFTTPLAQYKPHRSLHYQNHFWKFWIFVFLTLLIISQGSDAFTTPLAQYKPHDDHKGLRQRRRVDLTRSVAAGEYKPHDDHKGLRQRRRADLTRSVAAGEYKPHDDRLGLRLRRRRISFGPTWESEGGSCGMPQYESTTANNLLSRFRRDDYLDDAHYYLGGDDYYLGEGVDEVSQTISPPTVRAEATTDCYLNLGTASFVTARPRHTEQRNTPSILSPMNTPHLMDIQEDSSSDDEVHGIRKCCSQKMDFEWIFVITNIVLEFMSAIFTQLSSKQKPQYALFGMLLSYLALLTCIIELIYKDRCHRQIPVWRRRRGTWYYDRPQRDKSFATLNNIVALACALGQCVVTTINYRFENLIKVTILPIILAFGVLFSKIFKY